MPRDYDRINKEKIAARRKAKRDGDPAYRAKLLKAARQWRQANLARARLSNSKRTRAWCVEHAEENRQREKIRKRTLRALGNVTVSGLQCLDCFSEGALVPATEWDHWDGYEKPMAQWHVEPVCRRHNRIREVQRKALRKAA